MYPLFVLDPNLPESLSLFSEMGAKLLAVAMQYAGMCINTQALDIKVCTKGQKLGPQDGLPVVVGGG